MAVEEKLGNDGSGYLSPGRIQQLDVLFGAEGLIKEGSFDPTTCRKMMDFTNWDEFPPIKLTPMPS